MVKFTKQIICAFVFLIMASSNALADCDDPQTQADMNKCAADELAATDKELNEAYQKFTKDLSPEHLEALKTAQNAWIKYRDDACASYGLTAEGGSMEGMLVSMCKARITAERTDLLNDQFMTPEESAESPEGTEEPPKE